MHKIALVAASLALSLPAAAQTANAPATPTASTAASTTTFPSVSANEMFTSKIRGLNIYNQDNKSIGEIQDVAIGSNRDVQAYIVSVGGFLGLGERYVAINPASVDVHWDGNAKKWMAKMNATAEQLKAAPEFKYPS